MYKELDYLKIPNNKIETLDQVKELTKFENLTKLDLSNNKVTELEGYREKVFEAITKLEVLDGQTKDGKEYDSDSLLDDAEYGEEELDAAAFFGDEGGEDEQSEEAEEEKKEAK